MSPHGSRAALLLLALAGAIAAQAGEKSGHVRLEKQEGTWRLVAPDGSVLSRKTAASWRFLQVTIAGKYDVLRDAKGRPTNKPFPDPFDPRWEAALRNGVRGTAAHVDAAVAGWQVAVGEPDAELHRFVYSPACAAALQRFLEARYGASIDSLNKAWNDTRYASFDEVIDQKPDPVERIGQMYDDYRAFAREMVRHFNESVIKALRQQDPDRLVVSAPVTAAGEFYLDVYSDFDLVATGGSERRDDLELLHRKTGRPLLLTGQTRVEFGDLPFVAGSLPFSDK